MTRSTRSIRRSRLLAAGLATAAAAFAVSGAQPARAEPSGPTVPSTIAVEKGHKVFLVGHAVGVQIYSCNVTAGVPRWTFVAPRADLYGDNGQLVATHYAGPTWQTDDGSRVQAHRVDGVTVDPTAIPWLLLDADFPVAGPDGDRLAATTFIQRTATTGGVAPAAETCDWDAVGTVEEVPYTADYHFWKATGS